MATIRYYLPKPYDAGKTAVVQVRIPLAMKEEMTRLAKQNYWKASEVIRAGIQKFIEEERKKSA